MVTRNLQSSTTINGNDDTTVTPSSASNSTATDPNAHTRLIRLIQTFTADQRDLETFYPISISPTRLSRFAEYWSEQLDLLNSSIPFSALGPEGRVDWLLAKGYLSRQQRRTQAQQTRVRSLKPFLDSWAPGIIHLLESRQRVDDVSGEDAAGVLASVITALRSSISDIEKGNAVAESAEQRQAAYRAAGAVRELKGHLDEWFTFYDGYDPVVSWWIRQPWTELPRKMTDYADLLQSKVAGDVDGTAIVGQPLGREALLAELEAEVIAYSPEELIQIGEREYVWCEKQMEAAARELGHAHWREALEKVQNTYVEPGKQPAMVRDLAREAIDYVRKYDMISLPPIANECWRTIMMTPERQKVNPFFTGGDEISVSYPTDTMAHSDKLMSMRGNVAALSRSTVQHELVPGHHLQFYYMDRWNPHRKIFDNPFWIEGWAFYWEFILWDRGFTGECEQRWARNEAMNKIGMLFWRMHRCIRIVFSLKFHLGLLTPEECIEMLVQKVGHERATAEGEVRRSFNGDYDPLYQAAYMLGALQLYEMRKELVDRKDGSLSEKEFHDAVMQANMMPMEYLRALLTTQKLDADHQAAWKFYKSN